MSPNVESIETSPTRAREPRTPSARSRRSHAAPPERVDVAVVGAGLGGLVSAAYLARRGLSVAVFDAHYEAGGCATQFARGPKGARYHFDVGLHYVGDCASDGTIPRILGDLGVDVAFEPMDADGFDTLVFPDFRFRIPADLAVYRDRLVDMFPHEKRGIDRYVRLVRAVMNVSRVMDVHEGRRPPLGALARIALDGIRIAPHREATIGDVLSRWIRDPKLAAILLGQSGDYGLPPSRVSAILHLGLAGHYFRGAYYPRGGGQVIADRISDVIEKSGGSIHLRSPVEKILVEGGRAVGVRVAARAGEAARDVRASLVLSNADLKRTLVELVGKEHLPAEWVRREESFEMAAALAITFLGVKGDVRDLGMTNTNYWQFDGYDVEGFYAADRGEGPLAVRGCYVTSASMKDPSNARHHAPAGFSNVEVMAVVPSSVRRWLGEGTDAFDWGYKHDATYAERKRALEDELIRRFDAMFPGAAARVDLRETATPLTHSRFTGASDGTGYGLAATPAQFMGHRPGYRGPIDGLYLAGASTRSGHGIVGAMMSGRAAARRVLSDREKTATRAAEGRSATSSRA
ncbi:MAG TPA: NAD(P)/FAD-dependent oxidoreductase [Polyangiaceae bacterium]|nr:NAD(P)/FAD-dependent oxidoreductase [Polyangiaceae bacterium]